MRTLSLAVLAVFALAAPAAAANVAECKAHLTSSLDGMTADRFAEELAGAEGHAGSAGAATRNAAMMIADFHARMQDRVAEVAALKGQVARVQQMEAQLTALRQTNSTASSYLDPSLEGTLKGIEDSLSARVSLVTTTLDAERAQLDENLGTHCTGDAPASSASAH